MLDALILGSLRLLLIQVLLDVLRVDERHDSIEAEPCLDGVVNEEGLCNRRGVGKARRFDDDTVDIEITRIEPIRKSVEYDDEILPDCAAYALRETESTWSVVWLKVGKCVIWVVGSFASHVRHSSSQ